MDQRLGLCLTFALGRSGEQIVEGFGLDSRAALRDAVEETFDEADADPDRPKLRVGDLSGWTYAVEHFTTRGTDPAILCPLSGNGGEAFVLAFTQTISGFFYAVDSQQVNGFDLVVPHIRWGSEPHRFDARMEQAGFLGSTPRERAPAMAARFIKLTFGITIDRSMLERPLPSVDLV